MQQAAGVKLFDATVLGDVILHENANVWYGAVIRGDSDTIEIGKDSNVQDGTIIHTDHGHPVHIGQRVTIGHRAIVHGCTVEDEVMIGMGAIVMNGAKIGKHSIIGAGALVPEGKEIPQVVLWLVVQVRLFIRQAKNKYRKLLKMPNIMWNWQGEMYD